LLQSVWAVEQVERCLNQTIAGKGNPFNVSPSSPPLPDLCPATAPLRRRAATAPSWVV